MFWKLSGARCFSAVVVRLHSFLCGFYQYRYQNSYFVLYVFLFRLKSSKKAENIHVCRRFYFFVHFLVLQEVLQQSS